MATISKHLTLTLQELIGSIEFECKKCHMRLSFEPNKKPSDSILCACSDGSRKLVNVQPGAQMVHEVHTVFDAVENLRKVKADDDIEVRFRIELPAR